MEAFATRLRKNPIIPVLAIPNIECAEPLAIALEKGGLEFIEVTLRTDCAVDAIKVMKDACPSLKVGAGTILTDGDVDACINAGADFIVTPGTSPRLRERLIDLDCDVMVGVTTATEVMSRLEEGFGVLKFFPAEQFGGANTLKAFQGPLKHAQFCPTGGITLEKIPTYLALTNVVACGGSWIANEEMMLKGQWDLIEANSKLAAGFKQA
jgi:2-dehydro-3-deoxyphosphogluconate aldolase / (4S)-4-hydroxy-2-oxoglutarate aldolase